MPTLNIEGRKVTVDDSFTRLSPEQQNATVEEIASSFKSAQPVAPQPTIPDGQAKLSPFGIGMSQGVTANFGDEIFAGALTPVEMGIAAWNGQDAGKSLTERMGSAYDRALARERNQLKVAEAENPVATTAGNIAGGSILGGRLVKGGATLLSTTNPTMLNMVGRGMAEGAAYGGLFGLGSGEGADDRLAKGGVGAFMGGVGGGVAGGIGARSASKAMSSSVPTTAEVKAASQAAYQAADNAGLVLAPDVGKRVLTDVTADLTQFGYLPKNQPRVGAVLDEIEKLGQTPTTLKGYEAVRRAAGSLAKSADGSERELGRQIAQRMDNALGGLSTTDVVMGDAQKGIAALTEARRLWSQYSKSTRVDEALEKATRQAAKAGMGGNTDNAIRQRLAAILDDPKKLRGFNAEERQALEQAVKGTAVQNVARAIGKFAPNGIVSTAGSSGLGYALGGPVGAGALLGVGQASKMTADAMRKASVQQLSEIIRNGGAAPTLQALSPARLSVLEALMQLPAQQAWRATPIGMTP